MEIVFNPYVLLLIAFLLIFLEFFLPGGIMGIFGAIFIVLSLFSFVLEGHSPIVVFGYFLAVIAALSYLIRLILKAIRSTGTKNTIMLDEDQEGYIASNYDTTLIGKTGKALTDLKPAGKILIDGKEVQAVSELGYISRGKNVQVTGGEGAHLKVKEVGEV